VSTPATEGFHHVTLTVSDPERSVDFYRDALGLRRIGSGAPGGALRLGDADGSPGTLLELRGVPGERRGKPGIGGVHHTAFGVAEEEALLRWKRRLTDLGHAVSGPYDRGYFTSIYFRDPDGQVLEIATAGPGYAIDEPADALGDELIRPPQRIVRGHRDEAAIAALTHPEPVPRIDASMALQGIHHVSGITDDLERAGEFCERALGLRLVKRTTNRDDPRQLHYFWARWRDGRVEPHSSFTLFGWPPGWLHARPGAGQTLRVAFRSGGFSLPEWEDHLRSLGIEVERVEEPGSPTRLGLHAPDGLRVEVGG
jgi:glyoxalase family protein